MGSYEGSQFPRCAFWIPRVFSDVFPVVAIRNASAMYHFSHTCSQSLLANPPSHHIEEDVKLTQFPPMYWRFVCRHISIYLFAISIASRKRERERRHMFTYWIYYYIYVHMYNLMIHINVQLIKRCSIFAEGIIHPSICHLCHLIYRYI